MEQEQLVEAGFYALVVKTDAGTHAEVFNPGEVIVDVVNKDAGLADAVEISLLGDLALVFYASHLFEGGIELPLTYMRRSLVCDFLIGRSTTGAHILLILGVPVPMLQYLLPSYPQYSSQAYIHPGLDDVHWHLS